MPKQRKAKKSDVSEEFKSVVATLQDTELKERVVTLSKNEGELLKARKEDQALTEAKDTVKEYSAPYLEALKTVRSERQYIHTVLEERGK